MKKSVLLREGVEVRWLDRPGFFGGWRKEVPFCDYRLVLDSWKLGLKSRRTAKDREVLVYTLCEMQLA